MSYPPTYLPIYPPTTHLPAYPPTHLPPTYPPTHLPTYLIPLSQYAYIHDFFKIILLIVVVVIIRLTESYMEPRARAVRAQKYRLVNMTQIDKTVS